MALKTMGGSASSCPTADNAPGSDSTEPPLRGLPLHPSLPAWRHHGESMVRIGFRIPSLKKRLSARTSLKRAVRQRLGLKAPRGWGWVTNPKRAANNRVYNRTTRGCLVALGIFGLALAVTGVALAAALVR